MSQRRLAALVLLILLPGGCADDGGPEAREAAPTDLTCEEWVIGISDYAEDAKGSPTLEEALAPHVPDGAAADVIDQSRSRATAVVRRDAEVIAKVEARRTRRGWLVDTVERCQ